MLNSQIIPDTTQANILYQKAKEFQNKGRWDSLLYYFEKCYYIYRHHCLAAKNKSCQREIEIRNDIIDLKLRILKQRDSSTWAYIKETLLEGKRVLAANHPAIAKTHSHLGIYYFYSNQYDSALKNYRHALQLLENYHGKLPDNTAVSAIYNNMANVYRVKGKLQEASYYYHQALQTGLKALGERHLTIADIYNNIGVFYKTIGHYTKALEYLEKSLNIKQQLAEVSYASLAMAYTNIGIIHSATGEYDKAQSYYLEALKLYQKKENIYATEIADLYNNMGILYTHKMDYEKAISYYQKALFIYQNKGKKQKYEIAIIYNNLGEACIYKKEFKQAIQYFNQALSIFEEVGGNYHDLAGCYNNLGAVMEQQQSYDQAAIYFEKSIALLEAHFEEAHNELAYAYNNLGNIFKIQKKYAQALEQYQKAAAIYQTVYGQKHPYIAASYNNIAYLYLLDHKPHEALSYLQKAFYANFTNPNYTDSIKSDTFSFSLENTPMAPLELLETLKNKTLYLFKISQAHFESKQKIEYLQDILKHCDFALAFLAKQRTEYQNETSRISLGKWATLFAEQAIKVCFLLDSLENNKTKFYLKKAFLYSEAAKAGALQLLLQDAAAKKISELPDSLLDLELSLKRYLSYYQKKVIEIYPPKSSLDSSQFYIFQDQLFSLTQKIDSLNNFLEKNYPRYYQAKYAKNTINFETLQKEYLSKNSNLAIVEYFVGDSSCYAFAVTAHNFLAIRLPFTALILKKEVQGILYGIYNNHVENNFTKHQLYVQKATKLYQALMAPFAKVLKNKAICIIPDGELWSLPFELLLTQPIRNKRIEEYPKFPFLIKQHALKYFFTANQLVLPPQHLPKHIHEPRNNFTRGLLAVAPVFETTIHKNISTDERKIILLDELSQNATPLPGTRSEVILLKDIFSQSQLPTTLLVDTQATEKRLKTLDLKQFQYIHLATHGFFNRQKPALSGLLFYKGDSTEDGILFTGETYNLPMDAELITLSACETGQGELRPGEGLIGLTRGLMYSGAKNLVVSLWKVSDASTVKLMHYFYTYLLKGKPKEKALQITKKKLIHSHLYNHPHYWAPFVLIASQ
ncbi:MAG: tetratricopeptide repeat protein [Bacteroidia bacterium]|nr:tetratricopeptide repeat protein [Bacteroidia bacterium]